MNNSSNNMLTYVLDHDTTIYLDQVDSYGYDYAIRLMVALRQRLMNDPSINPNSTRGRSVVPEKNPTIAKVAKDTINGGRRRFFERHIDQLMSANPFIKEAIDSPASEMDQMKHIQDNARQLMCSRNIKYGDSWKVLSIQSIANLCEMKLHRIANLDKLEPKIEDELLDTINYCTFALRKLKNG